MSSFPKGRYGPDRPRPSVLYKGEPLQYGYNPKNNKDFWVSKDGKLKIERVTKLRGKIQELSVIKYRFSDTNTEITMRGPQASGSVEFTSKSNTLTYLNTDAQYSIETGRMNSFGLYMHGVSYFSYDINNQKMDVFLSDKFEK